MDARNMYRSEINILGRIVKLVGLICEILILFGNIPLCWEAIRRNARVVNCSYEFKDG